MNMLQQFEALHDGNQNRKLLTEDTPNAVKSYYNINLRNREIYYTFTCNK